MKSKETSTRSDWPINLSVYDKSSLSSEENSEIKAFLERNLHAKKLTSRKLPIEIQRITQPILDALCIVVSSRYHAVVMHLILERIVESEKIFWDWTENEWLEQLQAILNHDFLATRPHARNPILCLAYILGQYRGFHRFPRVLYSSIVEYAFPDKFSDLTKFVEQANEILVRQGNPKDTTVISGASYVMLYTFGQTWDMITSETILEIREYVRGDSYLNSLIVKLERAMASLGYLNGAILANKQYDVRQSKAEFHYDNIAYEWSSAVEDWCERSPYKHNSKMTMKSNLLLVGRWLKVTHPEIKSPRDWTQKTGIECVQAILTMRKNEWTEKDNIESEYTSVATIQNRIRTLRTFFGNLQQWNLIEAKFNPEICFKLPRNLSSHLQKNPEPLPEETYLKLLWAGLYLDKSDILHERHSGITYTPYPHEMIQALAIVWLLCGLRNSDIRNLELNCISTIDDDESQNICELLVSQGKSDGYRKPVDRIVQEAIDIWKAVRPEFPTIFDSDRQIEVDYLFLFRGKRIGVAYINESLIPMLCEKAGIDNEKHGITCHDTRVTMASQLFNAKNSMTMFELKEWLGHKYMSSTESYVKSSPKKLAESYLKATSHGSSLRNISLLLNETAIKDGSAADGANYKAYDLGHGLCTYDFFSECPHRLSCIRCGFYEPKAEMLEKWQEAKANIVRYYEEFAINDEDMELAITGDIEALDRLIERLANTAAPDGTIRGNRPSGFVALTDIS
jgi:integrase